MRLRKYRRILSIIILNISLLAVEARPQAGPRNNCIKCHEFMGGDVAKPVAEWSGSVHQARGITCDQCHGGNPGLKIGALAGASSEEIRTWAKQAMYAAPNFAGAPSGQAQFDLCAKCHADSVKNYAASIMGVAFLQKKGGPSCTKCHGAHRNVIPAVPESCKGCHKDTTGYERLQVMTIGEAQVRELSRIRIQIAGEKVAGKYVFHQHLESFETGLIAWGMVALLFLLAVGLYRVLEKGKR